MERSNFGEFLVSISGWNSYPGYEALFYSTFIFDQKTESWKIYLYSFGRWWTRSRIVFVCKFIKQIKSDYLLIKKGVWLF